MNTENFSIFETEIRPRMIIEASAGTGKTYTIVGLVIRLLLEEKIPVDKLLVVTFTRMATKELKDRILNRLRESYQALSTGVTGNDPFFGKLADSYKEVPDAASRINHAITNFDEANIYTIHGFCQQVLTEESLLTGAPFDLEIVQSENLLTESAEDFWRNFLQQHSHTPAGRFLISKVMKFGETTARLLKTLKPVIRHLSSDIEGFTDLDDPIKTLKPVFERRQEMARLWFSDKTEIISEMAESDVRYMTKKNIRSRVKDMDAFLSDPTYGSDTFEKLKYFKPSYHLDNLKKNGSSLPDHRFFQLCEEYNAQVDVIHKVQSWFLQWAARKIWQMREEKRSEGSQYTYDDLLSGLHKALLNSNTGNDLVKRLREKYPVALVDEFQDTDPIQYEILDHIYSVDSENTALLMIGDPKQAIYSFRGADVYSYLKAKNHIDTDKVYTLNHNFRSTPGLIQAFNDLFNRDHESPFLDENIPYVDISPGGSVSENDYINESDSAVPFSIFYLNRGGSKSDLKNIVFEETARQIRDMIEAGRKGTIRLRDKDSKEDHIRNLHSGDITVLVHFNRDASDMKRILGKYGVGAVTYSREKVFQTREAERLDQLLASVLNPADHTRLMTALSTGFFGSGLSILCRVNEDEKELATFTEQFYDLNKIWYQSGIYPMLRYLLYELSGLINLSELTDGERIISNIQQLVELIAEAEREHNLNPPAILRWLRKKNADPDSGNEEELLRLENDENLVKISTIHNSKGLEFPVVFCPTLWEGKDMSGYKPEIEIYHQDSDPYDVRINIDQSESIERVEARKKGFFEDLAEDVRKTYVALTRAKYACRVFWTDYTYSNISGLGAMIFGKNEVRRFISEKVRVNENKGLSPNILKGKLEQLSIRYPRRFNFHDLQADRTNPGKLTAEFQPEDLAKSLYTGPARLIPLKKKFSFTSLRRNETTAETEPDYDQQLDEYVSYSASLSADIEREKNDIFHFPRGKRAGTFIHKLFEHKQLDFRDPDMFEKIVVDQIEDFGFDSKWIPVLTRMMKSVSNANYNSMILNKVSPDQMLKEMQFHFPVTKPDLESITGIIRQNMNGSIKNVHNRDFMTGFIDLIVRQEGVYYILDYKSNYLGDFSEDYQKEKLAEEIRKADYDVQYHIYILALVKFLRKRDPSFEYRDNFGGVFYLFVRGIRENSDDGVYFHKPGYETIQTLENEFDRAGYDIG